MYKALFFLLFFSISSPAQIRGTVVNETQQAVSYVNIWVEDENNGTTADVNGDFTIFEKNPEKVLVFSALGYETKKVKGTEAAKVVLKQRPLQLQEVVITGKKSNKTTTVGDYKKGGINHFFSSGKTVSYTHLTLPTKA